MFDLNRNIPLLLSLVFMAGGLFVLSWSADKFVDTAAKLARAFGVSPLIVGMVIIGFGTSAPELAVSVLSGLADKADLSLGNAYGSCTFNVAAILGIAALVCPIKVKTSLCYIGVPILLGVTALSYFLVKDMAFSRQNGIILLIAFAIIMPLYCWFDQMKGKKNTSETADVPVVAPTRPKAKPMDFVWLLLGLVLLVCSSHVLVWGCVDFARDVLGVSPLLIGLTVVAAGTSLPELASAIASARRHEHEFVIGNIVGSNLFNMLAVVGISGTLAPFKGYSPYIVSRDLPMMALVALSIALFGINWRRPLQAGRIWRWEGALWIFGFLAYLTVMILQETGHWGK